MAIFDGFKGSEQEKKWKKKQELIQEAEATLDFQKLQKKIREKIKTKESLDMLKELVSTWFLSKQSVESILAGEIISHKEVQEILEKITQLQDLDSQNKVLPPHLHISHEEYLGALSDFEKKKLLLQKIDVALDRVYAHIWWGNIFSLFWLLSYHLLLSKNIQKIQWNLIDIKNDVLTTNTL